VAETGTVGVAVSGAGTIAEARAVFVAGAVAEACAVVVAVAGNYAVFVAGADGFAPEFAKVQKMEASYYHQQTSPFSPRGISRRFKYLTLSTNQTKTP